VKCKLGERTTTGDAEGEVTETRPVTGLDEKKIRKVLDNYLGEISQIPPMYSAVKHKGKRLYELAREGVVVEREARTVTIHELSLLSVDLPFMELDVRCSKGTYVRTLVEDVGEDLGCGAHVAGLNRSQVGPFDAKDMITMEALEALAEEGMEALDALLLPLESGLLQWPDVRLNGDAAYYLLQGQPVVVPHAPTDGWVRLYKGDDRFLGMGEILDDGRVAPRRLLNTG